jgi:hypothetical protein
MKGSSRIILFMTALLITGVQLSGQSQYSDFKTMSQRIAKLAADYPSLCQVKSLVKTTSGKDIWVLSIGSDNRDSKPAIAVVGGVEGGYLIGAELATGFAENLLKASGADSIKSLLDKITFYVIPNVNPDGSEQYFSTLKFESNKNSRSVDEDRDFSSEEDPFDDLNKDGFITLIRVTDPAGTMAESEEDKRILVAADLSKGQMGSYMVYSEGADNDKDGSFNEDGPGGVSFNKNFTFNYEEFGTNAGLHPVSEPESKAVADFLYDHFNIYATFVYGPQDNLAQNAAPAGRAGGMGSGQGTGMVQSQGQSQTPPAGATFSRQTGDRRITSVMRTDETINKLVSDKFREITGLKGDPPSKTNPGNFMDWTYYHYGRYSFGTPGWWVSADRGKSAEASFLKYAEDNRMEDVFVPWTVIDHPDFPGKKTEVGGIKPFVITNPPADKLADLASRHFKFIASVALMHPELEFIDQKVENLGENIYRVTVKVHNKGLFATCAEIGDNNQWTRIMRITVEPGKDQKFLNGQKVQRIQRLEGDKSAGFSWLVSGKGTLKLTAGALNVGTVNTSVELK